VAGRGEGLCDPRSHMFWEMLRVLRHLQTHQARVPVYILENVPLLGDIRSHVMTSVHQINRINSRKVLCIYGHDMEVMTLRTAITMRLPLDESERHRLLQLNELNELRLKAHQSIEIAHAQ